MARQEQRRARAGSGGNSPCASRADIEADDVAASRIRELEELQMLYRQREVQVISASVSMCRCCQ